VLLLGFFSVGDVRSISKSESSLIIGLTVILLPSKGACDEVIASSSSRDVSPL